MNMEIENITEHPLYATWRSMKQRCRKPYNKDFKNYGGRGIDYCARWENFADFVADMGAGYEKGLSLDRIDNGIGYSPANCRWATRTEQNNNTRRNHYICINGETKTLSQWVGLSGLKKSTVSQRIHAYGWPVERALGIEV